MSQTKAKRKDENNKQQENWEYFSASIVRILWLSGHFFVLAFIENKFYKQAKQHSRHWLRRWSMSLRVSNQKLTKPLVATPSWEISTASKVKRTSSHFGVKIIARPPSHLTQSSLAQKKEKGDDGRKYAVHVQATKAIIHRKQEAVRYVNPNEQRTVAQHTSLVRVARVSWQRPKIPGSRKLLRPRDSQCHRTPSKKNQQRNQAPEKLNRQPVAKEDTCMHRPLLDINI